MKYKVNLLGQRDCLAFCNKANEVSGDIYLTSNGGAYRVNGKSIMGCMLAISEWGDDIWVEADGDFYSAFESWIETGASDGNFIHA